MLLAVDVGNSHTVSGIFKKGQLVGNWRLQSRQDRTADELAIRYHGLFQMVGINPEQITGFIIASVVPMGWSGVTSMSSRGRLAVRVARASSEMPLPGRMVPPT